MKIYDCTTFYSEHLMLDVRFHAMNEHVEKFIITESTYSHSGKKKELNFDINNYPKFRDKIIYLVIDQEPDDLVESSIENSDQYKRINSIKRIELSYDYMMSEIKKATDNDLIIFKKETRHMGQWTQHLKQEMNVYIQKRHINVIPKVKYYDSKNLIIGMTYVGTALNIWYIRNKNDLSQDIINKIETNYLYSANIMIENGIVNNDIAAKNVCIDDNLNIFFIDFGWTTIIEPEVYSKLKRLKNFNSYMSFLKNFQRWRDEL